MAGKAQSDFLRVAVSGVTADGRIIKPEWLEQIAKNYDRDYYNARIWPEHIRGIEPGGLFKAQGDVLAAKTQVDKVKGEDKVCLYTRLEALPSLVDMVNKGEKLYTSIEIKTPFADSGEAYLVALAVTDSPSSLGTQALKFSQENSDRYFSEGLETTLTFTKTENSFMTEVREFMNYVRNKFSGEQGKEGDPMDEELKKRLEAIEARLKTLEEAQPAPAVTEEVKEEIIAEIKDEVVKEATEEVVKEATEEVKKAVEEDYTKLSEQVNKANEQYALLSKTDADSQHRPRSTGGKSYTLATC